MIKFLFLLLLAINPFYTFGQTNKGKTVPKEWISSALKIEDRLSLIHKFEELFPPEIKSNINGSEPYLNLTKINLDEDDESEYVLFIGMDYANTMLYLIDDDNKIIYQEYLWLHNDYPQLVIYNSKDQHKTLSYRYLYRRGSGQWLYTKKFLRIYNSEVFLVLEIVDDSNNTFNTRGINGIVRLTRVEESDGDFYVNYSYNLYPHEQVLENLGLISQDYSLIKEDDKNFIYNFDQSSKKYLLYGIDKNSYKPSYFFDPGDDSLFLKAFGNELDQIKQKGSPVDNKIVNYLKNKKN
jgi:hypothetical protein